MEKLSALLKRTFEYYQGIKHKNYVVNPAIPILYFGDVNAYFKSEIKIITVGKNPSLIEFPTKESKPHSFFRFPEWEEKKDYAAYATALNSYFEHNPYKKWFGSYEPILNGIDASYYSKSNKINRAIHTDICSPIATDPTWTGLSEDAQDELFNVGLKLWQDLTNILEPDILLISIAEHWLKQLNLTNKTEFTRFNKTKDGADRKTPYIVYQDNYLLSKNQVSKVYLGQAAQKPFGTLADKFKPGLGREILAKYSLK